MIVKEPTEEEEEEETGEKREGEGKWGGSEFIGYQNYY